MSIPKTSVYMHNDFLSGDMPLKEKHVYDQKEQTTHELLYNIKFGTKLGDGGYGITYKCLFKHVDYAIKLPLKLFRNVKNKNLEGLLLNVIVEQNRCAYRDIITEARLEMREECSNIEAILEPPLYKYRKELDVEIAETGMPLIEITHDDLIILKREMAKIRAHPGYPHWHPIVHVDFNIPCILSVPAHGTLKELLNKLCEDMDDGILFFDTNEKIPKGWLNIALQLTLAMDYMLIFGMKHHGDIKPDNILFKYEPDGSYHLWITDYGMCNDIGPLNRSDENRKIRGTSGYSPPDSEHEEWYMNEMPSSHLSIYQLFRTLISCIAVFQSSSIKKIGFQYIHGFDNIQEIRKIVCGNDTHKIIWREFKETCFDSNMFDLRDRFDKFRNDILALDSNDSKFILKGFITQTKLEDQYAYDLQMNTTQHVRVNTPVDMQRNAARDFYPELSRIREGPPDVEYVAREYSPEFSPNVEGYYDTEPVVGEHISSRDESRIKYTEEFGFFPTSYERESRSRRRLQ